MSMQNIAMYVGEIRESYRFDEDRLADWMSAHIDQFRGPLTVQRFKGGQPNPTCQLTTPSRSYVMRRKPPGELLKGAYAIDREYRVSSASQSEGSPVARGIKGVTFAGLHHRIKRKKWLQISPLQALHEIRQKFRCVANMTTSLIPTSVFRRQIDVDSQSFR